ncbi:MAG: hypothetical protein ACI9EW_000090 [Cellvibrionaceae bacterium]|jgi:hypothetical protein
MLEKYLLSITNILKIILFILAGMSLLAAFRALLTGVRSRSAASSQFFNVGRLKAQRNVFRSMLATISLVLLALLFLFGAIIVPEKFANSWFSTDEALIDEALQADETFDTEGSEIVIQVVTEISEPATLMPTVKPTETMVPIPTRDFIYVNSPIVGLYIRDLPDGDIIDVLDDRSRLSLSGESTIVDGINWILILTDEDREGWVAEQFTTVTLQVEIEPVPEN